jgi:hypothetical protein
LIVERTDFITVPITDMERSKRFYRETLSLDSSVCHMAFFTDPDGNQPMLHRRYAPRG